MSYWFELRDRLRGESAASALGRNKCSSGFSLIPGQADQIRGGRNPAHREPLPPPSLSGAVSHLIKVSLWKGLVRKQIACARTHSLVGEGYDKNEGHVVLLREQEGLQFGPAHGRHLDIRNHA
jgi:hypothetical protein